MRVILLKDIENLGKKWEVKEVADGYARNALLPSGLAKIATPQALSEAEHEQEKAAKEDERELLYWQNLATKLDGLEFTMKLKVSEEGTLYGGVNGQRIAEVLQGLGYEIKKHYVKLPEPIRELGEHAVTLVLPHGLEVQVKFIIEPEEEKIGEG